MRLVNTGDVKVRGGRNFRKGDIAFTDLLMGAEGRPDNYGLMLVDIEGGSYAVTTHIGPHEGLSKAWADLCKWLPPSGYSFGGSTPFELYLNDCAKVQAEELRTDLLMPLKAVDA